MTIPTAIVAGNRPRKEFKMHDDTRIALLIGGTVCAVVLTIAFSIGLGTFLVKRTDIAVEDGRVDRFTRMHLAISGCRTEK